MDQVDPRRLREENAALMQQLEAAHAQLASMQQQLQQQHIAEAAAQQQAVTRAELQHLQEQLDRALHQNRQQAMHNSFKPPSLSTLTGKKGDDIDSWLFSAEEYFDFLHIQDDERRVTIAGMSLQKAAKTWYHSVRGPSVPPERRLTTWHAFKAGLKSQFGPTDPVKFYRDKLADARQSGPVRDYNTDYRQICTGIPDLSEAEKLDRYVRGLKKAIRSRVEIERPQTFEEAAALAERLDSVMDTGSWSNRPFNRRDHGNHTSNRPSDGPTPMDLNAVERRNGHAHLTPEEKQRRKDNNLCAYCGSDKHDVHNCDVKHKGKGSGNGSWRSRGAK